MTNRSRDGTLACPDLALELIRARYIMLVVSDDFTVSEQEELT